MLSLRAVTDSQGGGLAPLHASFRVTFIVRGFWGQSSTPSTKS